MLALALSSIGIATASADPAPKTQGHGGGDGGGSGGFSCTNGNGSVGCIGSFVGLLPIILNVSNNSVLSGDDLDILSHNLNGLDIFNFNLNRSSHDTIVNAVGHSAYDTFNNDLDTPVSTDQVTVCTVLALGLQLCNHPD
jgi:hypothetical protein